MTPAQREAALRLADAPLIDRDHGWHMVTVVLLRELAAEPQSQPAPGYCRHCRRYTIEEPLPAEPQDERARILAWLDDALADTKVCWPGEIDILRDQIVSGRVKA